MKKNTALTTKALACCALLSALSVVLARLFSLVPDESNRFSLEAVPIFISGMLFGPVAGALVGFAADAVGCMFSGFGFNPLFCLPPILYGLSGGLFRGFLSGKTSLWRLAVGFLPPVVLGSVLYQSFALAYVYYNATFWQGLLLKLSTRSVQFAVTWALDVMCVYLLFRARIFERAGLWPLKTGSEKP